MIKNLENELDVALFDRSRKKLTLTDAGKMLSSRKHQKNGVLYESAVVMQSACEGSMISIPKS
jgi:hypothetical protein